MYAETLGHDQTVGQLLYEIDRSAAQHRQRFSQRRLGQGIEPRQLARIADGLFMIAHDGWDLAAANFSDDCFGIRAVTNAVSKADKAVHLDQFNVGQYLYQGFKVAMNV